MNRTEDRLKDALNAAARTVPDTAASPGLETREVVETVRPVRPAKQAWRRPVAALASAAALVAIVGVPALLLDARSDDRSGSWSTSTQRIAAADPPPFYMSLDADEAGATVRDSSTGERIDLVRGRTFVSLAAAPDQRTFYLARDLSRCRGDILRVRLTDQGTVAGTAVVADPESVIYRQVAVSPDGTRLAYSVASTSGQGVDGDCVPGDLGIGTLNLDTGSDQVWPARHGTAASPSWAPDSRTLTLLWVREDVRPPAPTFSGQVRVLDTADAGDVLDSRPVTDRALVDLPEFGEGYLFDPVVSPNGRFVLAVFGTSYNWGGDGDGSQALVRVSLANGGITTLDIELAEKQISQVALDASREHVLVYGVDDQDNPGGGFGVGRYDWESAEVNWFEGSDPPNAFAW